MTDLTKIDKPFGELDADTKIALFSYWVKGGLLQMRHSDGKTWLSRPADELPISSLVTYRAAVTKPSINWDHVASEFRWLARDKSGDVRLYDHMPRQAETYWHNATDAHNSGYAHTYASYTPGTCDWTDSLVQRPESAQ